MNWHYRIIVFCKLLLIFFANAEATGAQPTRKEFDIRDAWVKRHLDAENPILPFSFRLADERFSAPQNGWQQLDSKVDGKRIIQRYSLTDAGSSVRIDCDVVTYSDFPAVEWILYLENTGDKDTPLIEQIQALDLKLDRSAEKEFVVHYANGGQTRPDDFQPISESMESGEELTFGSTHELSSGTRLPFFGVEYDNGGFIAAIGWSGSWKVQATRDAEKSLKLAAGMYTSHTDSTRFVLHPGERVRTPRMLLMFWDNDRTHGHNVWRQLLLNHYCLRRNGEVAKAPLCALNWGMAPAEQQIAKINWWADHQMPIEAFWIDAGWSGRAGLKLEEWGIGAADRNPRPDLYPHGLRPIAEAAHGRGLQFLLWVWPHRVMPGVEVGAEHPEWVIPGEGLDHGDPSVNEWMISRYGDMIEEFDLDIFRQDGHPIIPADESAERRGIRQIRYFEGFYRFWDALLQRHPQLVIDNCAAGGRKIDIETMQRSIPLWRSDIQVNVHFDPVHMQCQTFGISSWVPISSGVSSFPTPYSMRSGYGSGLNTQWFIFKDKHEDESFDFATARRLLQEYRLVRDCFYGDYYPLTSYSLSHEHWMAWQFERSDMKKGLVQAFRRKNSPYQSACFKLCGLDASASYELTDRDTLQTVRRSGQELMETGFTIHLSAPDSAALITYKVVD